MSDLFLLRVRLPHSRRPTPVWLDIPLSLDALRVEVEKIYKGDMENLTAEVNGMHIRSDQQFDRCRVADGGESLDVDMVPATPQPTPTTSINATPTESIEETDTVNRLAAFMADRKKTVSACALAPTPSAGATLSTIATTQKKIPIYDGRPMSSSPGSPDMRGPPIEIFHDIFGYFRQQMDVKEPLVADDYDNVEELIHRLAARDQYENNREIDLTKHLAKLSGISIDKYKIHAKELAVDNAVKAASGAQGDGVGYIILDDGVKIPITHFEVKTELGGGGKGDAIYQAASVARKWAGSLILKRYCNVSCMPSLLVSLIGSTIQIWGFVFTSIIIMQPLTHVVYASNSGSRFGMETRNQLARLFRALRLTFRELEEYYRSLTPSDDFQPKTSLPARIACNFTSPAWTYTVELEYGDQLWPRDRWRPMWTAKVHGVPPEEARIKTGDRVLVKYSLTYNEQAHRLLAEKGLAPTLFSCTSFNDGSNLIMVVMEFVEGLHGEALVADLHVDLLPSDHHDTVRAALQTLHDHDIVFGDLRLPNVMVRHSTKKALLVDFDWCGHNGIGTYPGNMRLEFRDEGIRKGGIMNTSHDKFMFGRMTGTQW